MKMKKTLLPVALFLLLTNFLCAQNGYKNAVGVRFNTYIGYDVLALSYKSFLANHDALEFNLGFGGRNMYVPGTSGQSFSPGISLAGAYQYHVDIETATNEHLRWFAGGGLILFHIFSKNNFYEGFGAGLFGTCGIDYKFKNTPLNLTTDWRPTVYLSAPDSFSPLQIGTLGVAVRYTF